MKEATTGAQLLPTRYEQLISLLLAFYHPYHSYARLQWDIKNTLKIAHKTIIDRPFSHAEEIKLEIVGQMLALWRRARAETGFRQARGSEEGALSAIRAYVEYYYDVIFMQMADGERAILNHRFDNVAVACWTIYASHWQQEHTTEEHGSSEAQMQAGE